MYLFPLQISNFIEIVELLPAEYLMLLFRVFVQCLEDAHHLPLSCRFKEPVNTNVISWIFHLMLNDLVHIIAVSKGGLIDILRLTSQWLIVVHEHQKVIKTDPRVSG